MCGDASDSSHARPLLEAVRHLASLRVGPERPAEEEDVGLGPVEGAGVGRRQALVYDRHFGAYLVANAGERNQ